LAGLVGLLIFVFGFPVRGYVRAAPAFQDTPGYDVPTEDTPDLGYDVPATETPFGEGSPTAERTMTETSTLPPDVFRTEDSEMNNAQTTPLVTETPGPSITPYYTPTGMKTPSRSTSTPAVKKKGGFTPDWGMFWIGFSLPVLGACGVVLYLLDRRPDLFKHR
jgi:hypothetical protein